MSHLPRALPIALIACAAWSTDAGAWDRSVVQTFATVPSGAGNTEGMTIDALGNVYVSTFNVEAGGQPGQLIAFDPNGRLLRQVPVAGSSNLLLGLAFHPTTGALLMLDFGNPRVLEVDPVTGASTVFATIPVSATLGSAPNAMTFDAQGNVYVSDSFQGIVWQIAPTGGAPVAWVNSPLLRTTGVPPFGANGLDFNHDYSAMFVANTGDRDIVKIPVSAGAAGTPAVFVNSVGGADGLFVDKSNDSLWVVANQADEVVVLEDTGRVIAKLGDFDGIDGRGAPIGLLFPATDVRHGDWLYVTNFSFDIRLLGLTQAVDSPWTAQVTTHTIARIPAILPPIPGLH